MNRLECLRDLIVLEEQVAVADVHDAGAVALEVLEEVAVGEFDGVVVE